MLPVDPGRQGGPDIEAAPADALRRVRGGRTSLVAIVRRAPDVRLSARGAVRGRAPAAISPRPVCVFPAAHGMQAGLLPAGLGLQSLPQRHLFDGGWELEPRHLQGVRAGILRVVTGHHRLFPLCSRDLRARGRDERVPPVLTRDVPVVFWRHRVRRVSSGLVFGGRSFDLQPVRAGYCPALAWRDGLPGL